MSERVRATFGVLALGFLLLTTAGWWALALWPLPGEAPDWLARTRAVCFNAGGTGLPDASGWLLLIGQPIGMLAAMMAIWGPAVRSGLTLLARARMGRVALAVSACGLALGLAAAGVRVVQASRLDVAAAPPPSLPIDTYPRLDRVAPRLGLVDQAGRAISLEDLRGRPALVTFAFGQCETVCPLVVRETLEAQARQREALANGKAMPADVPRVVIVTLDPWRDTPGRLDHLAAHWNLREDGHVLSGDAGAVNAVLDAWNVARERDLGTGDVVHPPLVYVLDRSGRIAYAASGGVETLVELLRRS